MKKITAIIMTAFLALSLTAGCGGTKKEEPKKAAPAQKVLRVGTEPSFAPFEFEKKGSKELTGFDMDLIRAIGKKLNRKVEIGNMGFDALIPALKSGNIDIVASGMSITPERKKAVDFSDSYYVSGLIVVVNKDNNSVKGIDDLKGKKVAVQIGTTGADRAAKIPDVKVSTFNANSEVFMELKNKGVDAVIIDLPVAAYYLTQGGKDSAKLVGKAMDAESYGFAVNKGNNLAAEVNNALVELKKDGTYDKIYKTWFGEAPKK